MDSVILPPYQIAYIIGAPEYLLKSSDNVSIYTDNGNINLKEYTSLYSDLATYYYSVQEFFPLSNLLIAMENEDDALEFIKLGIKEACDYFDFRMIKHYCKLVCSTEKYTHIQLKGIYDMIMDLSYQNEWDMNTLHSYMNNIGVIRELLLNNFSGSKERIEVLIKTNIEKEDTASVNELYNYVNEVIKNFCSSSHVDSIELRHNSPYEFYITCIDSIPYIITFISALYGTLTIGNKFLDLYKNFLETKKIYQENDFYKYQKEEKELDIELRRLELLEKKTNRMKNNIKLYTVSEIEHNIRCGNRNVVRDFAPEILHYKYENFETK